MKKLYIPGGGILYGLDMIFDKGVVLLFVSIVFVVVDSTLGGGGDDIIDGGGDRGEDILLFSANCIGNIRVIGTGVGRDIVSVVIGEVVIVVVVVAVDVEELVHGERI
jgi:hypothetical protein